MITIIWMTTIVYFIVGGKKVYDFMNEQVFPIHSIYILFHMKHCIIYIIHTMVYTIEKKYKGGNIMKNKKVWLNDKDILELKEAYKDSIDEYTEYIDSYTQQKERERWNTIYRQRIDYCNKVLKEYEKILKELKEKNINYVSLTYSKGIFKLERKKDVYLYRKAQFINKQA